MAISDYLGRTITEPVNSFLMNGPLAASTLVNGPLAASTPPMTSKRAKQAAKDKQKNIHRLSEAQLRAKLKAEEDLRKQREALARKMIKQRDNKVRLGLQATEKAKAKLIQQKGKQPEGQHQLSKFGFIQNTVRTSGSEAKQRSPVARTQKSD